MPKIIIASGPVIVENGSVLLNKDRKDNFWKFCGGQVEEDDFNLKNTALREVKEEMGLDIEILDEAPYFFYTEKEKDGQVVSVILAHFLARRLGEVVAGEDILEWKWIKISDLDQEDLAPNIKPTLKHFGL